MAVKRSSIRIKVKVQSINIYMTTVSSYTLYLVQVQVYTVQVKYIPCSHLKYQTTTCASKHIPSTSVSVCTCVWTHIPTVPLDYTHTLYVL